MTRAGTFRWGALLVLLGLFLMHGATASAAESHCSGVVTGGHAHAMGSSAEARAVVQAAAMHGSSAESMPMSAASIGAPSPSDPGSLGQLCVAVLLTGLMAFLISRVRASVNTARLEGGSARPGTIDARPPPRPLHSVLSIWRN